MIKKITYLLVKSLTFYISFVKIPQKIGSSTFFNVVRAKDHQIVSSIPYVKINETEDVRLSTI
jgi:hypothetical protein